NLPFLERARNDIRPLLSEAHIRRAGGWNQLLFDLQDEGYYLQETSRGFVLTDGQEYVAASRVSRYASRTNLQREYGSFSAYLRERELAWQPYRIPKPIEIDPQNEHELPLGRHRFGPGSDLGDRSPTHHSGPDLGADAGPGTDLRAGAPEPASG